MATPTQLRLALLDHETARGAVNAAAVEREQALASRAEPLVQIAAWNLTIATLRGEMFTKAATLRALRLEPPDPEP